MKVQFWDTYNITKIREHYKELSTLSFYNNCKIDFLKNSLIRLLGLWICGKDGELFFSTITIS